MRLQCSCHILMYQDPFRSWSLTFIKKTIIVNFCYFITWLVFICWREANNWQHQQNWNIASLTNIFHQVISKSMLHFYTPWQRQGIKSTKVSSVRTCPECEKEIIILSFKFWRESFDLITMFSCNPDEPDNRM